VDEEQMIKRAKRNFCSSRRAGGGLKCNDAGPEPAA
jgi:hypothetical protein